MGDGQATLMGCHPIVPSEMYVAGSVTETRVSLCPRIRKVPIDESHPESGQNIRSVGQGQDQKSKKTGYRKDPGWVSQVKQGGRPQQDSFFCRSNQGPTAVPYQGCPPEKASKPLGKVKVWLRLWVHSGPTGSWLSVGSRNANTASVYMPAE